MARLSDFVGAVLRDLRRTGAAGLAALVLTALAVLVTGATLTGLEALGRLIGAWRAELRIVAVLGDAPARTAAPPTLVGAAQALPGVASVRFVSTAEALAELRRYLGSTAAGLDRLAVNPLPARLEVIPVPGADAARLAALVESLGHLPGVESVQAALGWVEPAERLTRALRGGGLALGSVLALAAVLALAGGARVARLRRAAETALLRLAGVPEGRLWSPLVLQAAVQGGAGAALGITTLLLATDAGSPAVAGYLRSALGVAPLPWPGWGFGLAFVGGGVAAGLVGGAGAGRP
jgi:cell division protein FtsX